LLEKRTAVFSELIDEIKIRLHNQEDHILPMGYTGALHPILEIKELKREVNWCLQNPWHSGILDVFDVSPSFMLPFVPDLYREEALSVYLRAGFTRIGIIRDIDAFHTFRSQVKTKDGPMELYSLLRHSIFNEFDTGALSRVFKKQESTRLFLLLDLSSYPPKSFTSEADIIRRFLDGLSRTYNLTFHHLLTGIASFDRDIFTPDDNTVIRPEDDEYSYDLMDNPATRSMMLNVSSLRNQWVNTAGYYRAVLKRMAPAKMKVISKDESPKPPVFPKPDHQNIAAMQGNIMLSGSLFTAHFASGRLLGIEENGSRITPFELSQSYLRIGGQDYPFSPISSFSIEGENSRGLRSIENVEGLNTGISPSFLTDYIFVDDFPFLMVSIRVRYPVMVPKKNLSAVAPVEHYLARLEKDEFLTVWSLSKDGSRFMLTFGPTPMVRILAGSLFFIQKKGKGILLGFPPYREPSIGMCAFTVEKHKNHSFFKAAPFGSYNQLNAEKHSGVEELFSYFIGTDNSCPDRIPHFPPNVLEEIPGHNIRKL
jgi:hypothetical protein